MGAEGARMGADLDSWLEEADSEDAQLTQDGTLPFPGPPPHFLGPPHFRGFYSLFPGPTYPTPL